ncbi:hypothetical protein HQ560_20540, partial [bacterium]|nr:hypothetical protein [bacterium]
LFWNGKERDEATFTVRAPQGYRVYALPDGFSSPSRGWVATAAFRLDPGGPRVAIFHDVWQRTALEASEDRYASYRTALVGRSRMRGEAIVFVKNTVPKAAPQPPKTVPE